MPAVLHLTSIVAHVYYVVIGTYTRTKRVRVCYSVHRVRAISESINLLAFENISNATIKMNVK